MQLKTFQRITTPSLIKVPEQGTAGISDSFFQVITHASQTWLTTSADKACEYPGREGIEVNIMAPENCPGSSRLRAKRIKKIQLPPFITFTCTNRFYNYQI